MPYWIGFGDIHDSIGNIERIPGMETAAGVILSGDLTNIGGAQQAERVIGAVRTRNPTVYAQIGNMDTPGVDDFLSQGAINIHRRGLMLDGDVALVGVGYSNPTPFMTPSEVPDQALGEWLDEAYARVRSARHVLLVSHTPPHDTKADRLGDGTPVGSQAVRAFIERAQPEVCLTGHIHEARGVDTIGRTTIVNPGMLSAGGYVRIVFDGAKLSATLGAI
jgi:Icc-related predicted phosphoesterase